MPEPIYRRPSEIQPGDRLVTNFTDDATVRAWEGRPDGTYTARIDGPLGGTGLSVRGPSRGFLACCRTPLQPYAVLYDDATCGNSRGVPHPLSDQTARALTADGRLLYTRQRDPLVIPELAWFNNHPTIADPEGGRSSRLRRCIRCNLRSDWENSRCAPGLIVHLLNRAAVERDPAAYAGVPFASPQEIDGATRHWQDQGFTVSAVESFRDHPGYRACPVCNREAMEQGRLAVFLPPAAQPAAGGGYDPDWADRLSNGAYAR